MSEFNRNIPTTIRRQLRREVSFGCPVQDCGIPFLTYHHFDPPYRTLIGLPNSSHNPNGIVGLCHVHADHADGGAWTNEQLREMKRNPFLKSNTANSRFYYKRDQVLVRAGNLNLITGNILELNDERTIGFEKNSNDQLELNLLIRDSTGNIVLQMENNDWIVYTDNVFDLICPAQGKNLQVKSKDGTTDFRIRYDEISISDVKKELTGFSFSEKNLIRGLTDNEVKTKFGLTNSQLKHKKSGFDEGMVNYLIPHLKSKEKILLVTITGILQFGGNPITITKNSCSWRGIYLKGNILIGFNGCALTFRT